MCINAQFMMRNTAYAFMCIAVLLFSGCTKIDSKQIADSIATKRASMTAEVETALRSKTDVKPLPKDWQKIVTNTISSMLKDPDSAKYSFTDTPDYYGFSNKGYKGIKNIGPSPTLGYVGSVFVNAKNGFGGYGGNELYLFIISGNDVVFLARNPYNLWHSTSDAISGIGKYEVFLKP